MSQSSFSLNAPFTPTGDQPQAINTLLHGLTQKEKHQTLLGITGSGKTFTMANIIAASGKPSLIIAPNKTLAAQLCEEFKILFPKNAVHYFVSYYDYYQPEAYIASTDTYIEKDSYINEDIDRMRHAATFGLLSRKDVIIVASVSCIFGIGAKETYAQMKIQLSQGEIKSRDEVLHRLVELQYQRNDVDFHRSTFRVRGDTVEVFPSYNQDTAIRIEWFGDEISDITEIDPIRGISLQKHDTLSIFAASHYATERSVIKKAIINIQKELKDRLSFFDKENLLLEKQRLEQRTLFDIEMLEETGFCKGIENYSRHLTGQAAGQPPPTLMDYFPEDFLLFIDESHQAIPQIGAMYQGDNSRKTNLVEHGFRLPSAVDNRPLKFKEWEERTNQVIYVSATPGDYELKKSKTHIVEQIIRPTGLLDPIIDISPVKYQVDDLLKEIQHCVEKKQRVLVTTLTKRMAEDLTEYYTELGIRVQYLHSDIKTLERIEIIRGLRLGEFDVLIGINLLREGLDIPEVSLVAILDADKEGFLRSERSLIQTCGRAARHIEGRVIMYADKTTASMQRAIEKMSHRRMLQHAHNEKHNIIPTSTQRQLETRTPSETEPKDTPTSLPQLRKTILKLRQEMKQAAKELNFEQAAKLRDRAKKLSKLELLLTNETNML